MAWSVSAGEKSECNKFVTTQKQVTCDIERNSGQKVSMKGVQTYFPKLTGHGVDDLQGEYTLVAQENTKINDENIATVKFR